MSDKHFVWLKGPGYDTGPQQSFAKARDEAERQASAERADNDQAVKPKIVHHLKAQSIGSGTKSG